MKAQINYDNDYCSQCNTPLLYPDKPCPKCDYSQIKIKNTSLKVNPKLLKGFILLLFGICMIFVINSAPKQSIVQKPLINAGTTNHRGINELYRYDGFYAYYLPKNKFNLKKVLKLSQSKEYSSSNYLEVFYYDKPINKSRLENSNKNAPFFLIDEAYKLKPYFVFNGLYNNQEWYCNIDGTYQEYYHRNILQNDTTFKFLSVFDYEILNGLTGCNPYYKQKQTDIILSKKKAWNDEKPIIEEPIYEYPNESTLDNSSQSYEKNNEVSPQISKQEQYEY